MWETANFWKAQDTVQPVKLWLGRNLTQEQAHRGVRYAAATWGSVAYRSKKLRHRLGLLETLVLTLGTTIIIACVVVLCSFWTSSRGIFDTSGGLWYKTVVTGWASTVITITTAVMRTCLAAQTVTCCFMLASLALEYRQVRPTKPTHIEHLAALQHSSAGPLDLLLPFYRGWRQSKNPAMLITAVVLVAIALGSQLFSTLLMQDVQTIVLAGYTDVEVPVSNYSFTQSDNSLDVTIYPFQFPLFAERSSLQYIPTGFSDVGTIRAYFPLSQAQRTAMNSYYGPASILRMEHSCIAPALVNVTATHEGGNLKLSGGIMPLWDGSFNSSRHLPYVNDHWATNMSKLLYTRSYWAEIGINCSMPFGTITSCGTVNLTGGSSPGYSKLIIEVPEWKFHDSIAPRIDRYNSSAASVTGDWATGAIAFKNNTSELITDIKLSLCAVSTKSETKTTLAESANYMWSQSTVVEPDAINNSNLTWWITEQLGTPGGLPMDRQTEDVTLYSSSLANSDLSFYISSMHNSESFEPVVTQMVTDDWCLSTTADTSVCPATLMLHPTIASVVAEVLFRTDGQVSKALESLTSLLYSTTYYRNLATARQDQIAHLSNLVAQPAPQRFVGFAIVMSFVVVHFCTVAIILIVFARSESLNARWTSESFRMLVRESGDSTTVSESTLTEPLITPPATHRKPVPVDAWYVYVFIRTC